MEKYGRAPITYPGQPGAQYEDLEYQRALAYENGEMAYLMPSQQEQRAASNKRKYAMLYKMRIDA